MPELLSGEALAKLLGVSGQAVRKAHAAGRISSIDGRFDPALARMQWEANRKRRRTTPTDAKPVHVAAVEREIAGRLVILREALDQLSVQVIALRETLDGLGDEMAARADGVGAEPAGDDAASTAPLDSSR